MDVKTKVLAFASAMLLVTLISGTVAIQQVYAQTTNSAAADWTGLIVAVASLIGAISTLVGIGASKYLAGHKDSKMAQEIVNGSNWLAGTDDRIIEHADDIVTAIDIIGKLNPDIQKKLEEHQVDANALREKADQYKIEVDRARALANKVL